MFSNKPPVPPTSGWGSPGRTPPQPQTQSQSPSGQSSRQNSASTPATSIPKTVQLETEEAPVSPRMRAAIPAKARHLLEDESFMQGRGAHFLYFSAGLVVAFPLFFVVTWLVTTFPVPVPLVKILWGIVPIYLLVWPGPKESYTQGLLPFSCVIGIILPMLLFSEYWDG